ncbi:MAG TPA: helix-turn-helix domain-containing protein [Acidimicrobiales bacterium]|nr:helix-turn-helix domain-containing protein [Acidimicrobiales bacterium]
MSDDFAISDDASIPLLLTVKEAAWILQISRSTVYELLYAGLLLSVKIGTCRRIRRSDLENYVQGLAVNS